MVHLDNLCAWAYDWLVRTNNGRGHLTGSSSHVLWYSFGVCPWHGYSSVEW